MVSRLDLLIINSKKCGLVWDTHTANTNTSIQNRSGEIKLTSLEDCRAILESIWSHLRSLRRTLQPLHSFCSKIEEQWLSDS